MIEETYPEKEERAYFVEFFEGGHWKLYRSNKTPDSWFIGTTEEERKLMPKFLHPYWILDGQLSKVDQDIMTNETKAFIKYMVDALNQKHERDIRSSWP